jgi:hypothetical protein
MMGDLARAVLADLDEEALGRLAARLASHMSCRSNDTFAGENRWMPPGQAAGYLGVSRRRVYDLKSMGAIVPDGYDGRTPLFRRSTLDRYAEQGLIKHG